MEISRLIFTKETKEKMNKELTRKEKGKLRYNKLEELADNGKLSLAKNRIEVANLVGVPDNGPTKTGYKWVSGLVRNGYVKETVTGIGRNGKMEFEYSLTSKKPNYEFPKPKSKSTNAVSKKAKASKLSLRERGKIMYEKLKNASDNGALEKAKTRGDVAELVDGTRSWVSGLIERGFLREVLYTYENGLPAYKYNLTGKEPNYDYVKKTISATQTETISTAAETQTTVTNKEQLLCKVEITKGDILIKLELSDYDKIGELVTTILKGE